MRRWQQQVAGETWTFQAVSSRTLARHLRDSENDLNLKPSEVGGFCLPDRKRILFDETLTGADLRALLAHEILHAVCPNMSHRRINAVQDALFEALKKL